MSGELYFGDVNNVLEFWVEFLNVKLNAMQRCWTELNLLGAQHSIQLMRTAFSVDAFAAFALTLSLTQTPSFQVEVESNQTKTKPSNPHPHSYHNSIE